MIGWLRFIGSLCYIVGSLDFMIRVTRLDVASLAQWFVIGSLCWGVAAIIKWLKIIAHQMGYKDPEDTPAMQVGKETHVVDTPSAESGPS